MCYVTLTKCNLKTRMFLQVKLRRLIFYIFWALRLFEFPAEMDDGEKHVSTKEAVFPEMYD